MPTKRDHLLAFMVAELDARRHQRGPVVIVSLPEDEQRERPAVELIASDERLEMAVEHTLIERSEEQIRERHRLLTMFPRGGVELNDRADAWCFELAISAGALGGIGYNKRARFSEQVSRWVAARLDEACETGSVWGEPPNLPCEGVLQRVWADDTPIFGLLPGVVAIRVVPPDDLEYWRVDRLQRALQEKVPKLLAAATGSERRSILLLENRDADTSPPTLVIRGLRQAAGVDRLPDAIYMVHVGFGDPLALVLYEDGEWAEGKDLAWEVFPSRRCGAFNLYGTRTDLSRG